MKIRRKRCVVFHLFFILIEVFLTSPFIECSLSALLIEIDECLNYYNKKLHLSENMTALIAVCKFFLKFVYSKNN